jgi:hypothetical protein
VGNKEIFISSGGMTGNILYLDDQSYILHKNCSAIKITTIKNNGLGKFIGGGTHGRPCSSNANSSATSSP